MFTVCKRGLFVLVIGVCLMLASAAVWAQATPVDAVADVVANSGMFPAGTTVVSVDIVGSCINVDLSPEAVAGAFGDTRSDDMVEAICGALGEFSDLSSIEVTVGGQPLWTYLPPAAEKSWDTSDATFTSAAPNGMGFMAAQSGILPPFVTPQSSELAGKLVVLHPSHGSYATATSWIRAQRTFSGPGPKTAPFPPGTSSYQPSDYYYRTRGFTWPAYYEDDMSPETIRFLYAYCQSAGAATYCSRALDKTPGVNFDYARYGYATPPASMRPLPLWMCCTKYNLQTLGYPQSVWDEPSLPVESDKDLRARAYFVNYLMQTLGYTYNNTVSFSLHSNAANTGTNPPGFQAQARGTETYYYTTQYPTQQARSPQFCTAMENGVISAIRNQYDGKWAESQYSAVLTPVPQEWYTPYGTYRGYLQTGATNTIWQDRGVKTSNFGEIREVKAPAQLMELLFHDDWKFYPDEAFHQDKIFRATIAWGMYQGICSFFSVTPKPYLGATVDNVSFPDIVGPNTVINGTVTMKNQGMAWTWGNKMIGTVYSPYTIWNLQATAGDQFGAAGTKIAIADDGNYYPGDTATFAVSLTAPAITGLYTTSWQMLKDAAVAGGAFGAVASAQIQVDADAPDITIDSPDEGQLYGPSVPVSFSATDALSAVASLTADIDGTAVTSGSNVTLGSGSHTLTVVAVDTFGNTNTETVTFQVDADPPVITITSPVARAYAHCGSVVASFGATDTPAGVASVSATIDGNPIPSGGLIGLLWGALGTHTLVVTAVDNVGNSTSSSVSFTVVASLESLACAINQLYAEGQIDNQGIQNSLLVKLAKYEKDTGDVPNAKNYLKNFINEVSAQSGKHLTVAAANLLLSDAAYVIAHLPGG